MAKRKMSTFERLRSGSMNRQERKEWQQRLYAEDAGLEAVHPDAAGIDVGNASHFVAVPADRDQQPVREFGSWTADLQRMAEWLKRCGIRTVAMQSTGVYWVALQEVLERDGFEVCLVNARGTKNLPGRKSDVQECQWLMKLHTDGLLRNSFHPPEQIRAVRTIWRQRDRLVKAALAVGIGISTLWRWMKEREFKAAFLQARREAVSQAIARIQQATGAAGVTILKLMTDPNVPAAVRLRAAECVFSMAVKGIEIEDTETRLSELEQAAEASTKQKK